MWHVNYLLFHNKLLRKNTFPDDFMDQQFGLEAVRRFFCSSCLGSLMTLWSPGAQEGGIFEAPFFYHTYHVPALPLITGAVAVRPRGSAGQLRARTITPWRTITFFTWSLPQEKGRPSLQLPATRSGQGRWSPSRRSRPPALYDARRPERHSVGTWPLPSSRDARESAPATSFPSPLSPPPEAERRCWEPRGGAAGARWRVRASSKRRGGRARGGGSGHSTQVSGARATPPLPAPVTLLTVRDPFPLSGAGAAANTLGWYREARAGKEEAGRPGSPALCFALSPSRSAPRAADLSTTEASEPAGPWGRPNPQAGVGGKARPVLRIRGGVGGRGGSKRRSGRDRDPGSGRSRSPSWT